MNIVSKEEVEGIARLARVALEDGEKEAMANTMTSLLSHFDAIKHIDTAAISSEYAMSGLRNIVREDQAHPNSLSNPETLMQNTPATHNGYVKVSAVFSDTEIL